MSPIDTAIKNLEAELDIRLPRVEEIRSQVLEHLG